MRVRAVVAYDGTDYHGFQRQAPEREPTIQGALERALASIGRGSVAVVGSGRTDAGVHASGQVVAFEVEWGHGLVALQRALNATLPPAIALFNVEEALANFHPRYDALSRQYIYTIYNSPVRHPLYARYSWYIADALDVEQMHLACQPLVGEHDLAAFGQPTGHQPGESTVRRVDRAECRRTGAQVYVEIEASGFLYHMMRSIVGTVVAVGRGKLNVQAVAKLLESRQQSWAGPLAPPHGLCLTRVTY